MKADDIEVNIRFHILPGTLGGWICFASGVVFACSCVFVCRMLGLL